MSVAENAISNVRLIPGTNQFIKNHRNDSTAKTQTAESIKQVVSVDCKLNSVTLPPCSVTEHTGLNYWHVM